MYAQQSKSFVDVGGYCMDAAGCCSAVCFRLLLLLLHPCMPTDCKLTCRAEHVCHLLDVKRDKSSRSCSEAKAGVHNRQQCNIVRLRGATLAVLLT
jgi:hypothetical protein